jgi:hypothetical protein
MCGLRTPSVAASRARSSTSNETKPKIAEHPGKSLCVVMPRYHRPTWDHRRIDAREQQKLAVPQGDD